LSLSYIHGRLCRYIKNNMTFDVT